MISEECDELWAAIHRGDSLGQEEEAAQVGAMALRFLVDCCMGQEEQGEA